ncbi:MAG TPA: peptidase M23, partial [Cyanothece sp. UBA12306]|nr:peptidase M23 [Cyanothece sp. UBA12306]
PVKPQVVTPSPVKIPKSSFSRPQAPATKPVLEATPVKPTPPKVAPKPSVSQYQKSTAPKVQLSAPKILDPSPKVNNSLSIKKSVVPIQSKKTPIAAPAITQGKNSYIDPTSYGLNPKNKVVPPTSIVITERATGCQTFAQKGQLITGQCPSVAKTTSTRKTQQAVAPRRISVRSGQKTSATRVARNFNYSPKVQPAKFRARRVSPKQVVSLQPIARKGLSISLEPVPKYNRAASLYSRMASQQGPSQTDLMYPLPVAAKISSAFGWRIHPIARTGRQHEGTDIAAPLGTPVLATYQGQVAQADWAGGYGLMVILRHLEGTQESRYAHLSEIYVQPGEWVEQGTVIGRVGNTGYSTGPHLHFEWRHLTEQGWVAVDAGVHLEYALGNLMRSLQMAEAQAKPQG